MLDRSKIATDALGAYGHAPASDYAFVLDRHGRGVNAGLVRAMTSAGWSVDDVSDFNYDVCESYHLRGAGLVIDVSLVGRYACVRGVEGDVHQVDDVPCALRERLESCGYLIVGRDELGEVIDMNGRGRAVGQLLFRDEVLP